MVVVNHVTRGVSISFELHDSSIPERVPRHSQLQSPVTLTFSSNVWFSLLNVVFTFVSRKTAQNSSFFPL